MATELHELPGTVVDGVDHGWALYQFALEAEVRAIVRRRAATTEVQS